MSDAQITRRGFLADATRVAAAGSLALHIPWLAALAGCAPRESGLVVLTPAEARAMRAFAAQVIPSDDGSPGAEEAGALQFIDRALGLPYFADSLPIVRDGLADLDAQARTIYRRREFASLSGTQQVAIMRRIDREPFFTTARTLVVIGTLADPSYGGNRDRAGWAMLGIDHRPVYTAPYGWYDSTLGVDSATLPS